MGTNYYARINICKCCNNPEEIIHIGKSSFGWTFTFHATDEIRNYKEWLEILCQSGTKIFDEYDREISLVDFGKLVDSKKDEKNNHAKQYSEGSYVDKEGHSMSEGEFS